MISFGVKLVWGSFFIALARRVTVDDTVQALLMEEENITAELKGEKCCAGPPAQAGGKLGSIPTTKKDGGCGESEKEIPLECCLSAEAIASLDSSGLQKRQDCHNKYLQAYGIPTTPPRRLKTLYIVRHGESEANVALETGVLGALATVVNPLKRKKLIDSRLTVKGPYRTNLKTMYDTLHGLPDSSSWPPEAYLASPLTRATMTAVIAFQDQLKDGTKRLEMLPLIRERKKVMVTFGDMGRIYKPAKGDCKNGGFWDHIIQDFEKLLAESQQNQTKITELSHTTEMLSDLMAKLPGMKCSQTFKSNVDVDTAIDESPNKAELTTELSDWYNACKEWWGGSWSSNGPWKKTSSARVPKLGKLLGLRSESSIALTGHSHFWLDFFLQSIDLTRFSYLEGQQGEDRIRKAYVLASLLTRERLQNANIVKVTIECGEKLGDPCTSISNVEDVKTLIQFKTPAEAAAARALYA